MTGQAHAFLTAETKMKPASMLPSALATFVASIMVAATVLAAYTALHLQATARKVNNQEKIIKAQQRKIDLLVEVSSAQHDLITAQQVTMEKMIGNERGLLKIFTKGIPVVSR